MHHRYRYRYINQPDTITVTVSNNVTYVMVKVYATVSLQNERIIVIPYTGNKKNCWHTASLFFIVCIQSIFLYLNLYRIFTMYINMMHIYIIIKRTPTEVKVKRFV